MALWLMEGHRLVVRTYRYVLAALHNMDLKVPSMESVIHKDIEEPHANEADAGVDDYSFNLTTSIGANQLNSRRRLKCQAEGCS
jgi:hypothetical protein